MPFHHNDVVMSAMASQITSLMIVYSTFIQAQFKENIKAPRHWPLCGEFTGDRWSPRTRPVTRKMFPVDDVIRFVYLKTRSALSSPASATLDMILKYKTTWVDERNFRHVKYMSLKTNINDLQILLDSKVLKLHFTYAAQKNRQPYNLKWKHLGQAWMLN